MDDTYREDSLLFFSNGIKNIFLRIMELLTQITLYWLQFTTFYAGHSFILFSPALWLRRNKVILYFPAFFLNVYNHHHVFQKFYERTKPKNPVFQIDFGRILSYFLWWQDGFMGFTISRREPFKDKERLGLYLINALPCV